MYLGQNEADAANRENQAVIEEGCELLVRLLKYSAESDWRNVHRLAEVPVTQTPEWLEKCLNENLIAKIRQTPTVVSERGAISPEDSVLPFTKQESCPEALWDLLDELTAFREKLPRRNESTGWRDAVHSWARLASSDPLSFNETIDGRKLAQHVHNVSHDPLADHTTHRINRLQLREGTSGINWLDQLLGFLQDNGLDEAVSEHRIVPSQRGFLRTLPNLHRDQGIDEELKTIARLLGWHIKGELRDTRLLSLAEKPGAGDWDNEYVVGELINRLRKSANEAAESTEFNQASVRLFAWIVEQEKWDRLRGFPMFTDGSAEEKVIYLPMNSNDSEQPLAPVQAWPVALRPFYEIFPPNRVLSNDFFDKVPEPSSQSTMKSEG